MKRRDEVLVGLLLIAAVTVGVAGTVWLARGGLSSGYEMYVRFPWGAGLKNGQPVLLAGVNIGFVKSVKLDPNGTLVVTLAINEEYQVPEGTTAAVAPNGIFGDQLIALQPQQAVTTYMAQGDTIPTGKGTPTTGDLLTKGDSIAKDVEALSSEPETPRPSRSICRRPSAAACSISSITRCHFAARRGPGPRKSTGAVFNLGSLKRA